MVQKYLKLCKQKQTKEEGLENLSSWDRGWHNVNRPGLRIAYTAVMTDALGSTLMGHPGLMDFACATAGGRYGGA